VHFNKTTLAIGRLVRHHLLFFFHGLFLLWIPKEIDYTLVCCGVNCFTVYINAYSVVPLIDGETVQPSLELIIVYLVFDFL